MVAGISEVKSMRRPVFSIDGEVQSDSEVPKKIVYDLSEDQKELRSIRMSLGMTKHGFSKVLNIKQCTLDSYEYGKTKGVPLPLMDSARTLASEKSTMILNSKEMFESKSMSSILEEWAETLHIPAANATALGMMLNTTATTIRRWRKNEVRPDIGKLSKLAARVQLGPVSALKISAIYAVKKIRRSSAESKGSVFIPETSIKLALDRLNEITKTNEKLGDLVNDFVAAVGMCKKIPGDIVFIQMNSSTLQAYVKKFLAELTVTGFENNEEEDEDEDEDNNAKDED